MWKRYGVLVKMKVLNIKNNFLDGVYIGRGSAWGNPFKITYESSRLEVIQKFRIYAIKRLKEEPNWLEPLRGKDLVCYCAPLACHGDVIVELIERKESDN